MMLMESTSVTLTESEDGVENKVDVKEEQY